MARINSQRKLARQLQLSPMTVSRALRGEDGVSEEVRQRILDAARGTGLATPVLSRLRDDNGRLHVLCTMAPEPGTVLDSPFHARLLEGLRRGARECGSEMVNCAEVNYEWPLVVARKQVDGAILVWGDEHDPKPSDRCPVPAVFMFFGPAYADLVTVDNFGGAFELGRHLAARGHRRVAFVGPDSRVAVERLAGLRAGLQSAGGDVPQSLALLRRGGAGGGSQARALTDELLTAGREAAPGRLSFSAVMAYNDYLAAHVMERLDEAGLSVPGALSVVGFDGVAPVGYQGPALTTCAIPLEELGAESARFLYWRLDHPTAARRVLALGTELVSGASVAAVPAG